jgi:glycosyltransferase involved in cell wall biosynthesis
MLVLLLSAITLEMVLYFGFSWPYRLWLGGAALVLGSFALGLILVDYAGIAAWLLLTVHIFRVINILRLAQGRMHKHYLIKVTKRTSLVFAITSLALVGLVALERRWPSWFAGDNIILWLAWTQLLVAVTLLTNTFRRLSRMSYKSGDGLALSQAPTVTVAIPARNETASLSRLLDSIIISDYPKLEILVLDDCSQDQTSDVIKSYAQAGVRFLHGEEPITNWVAKNQAYQQLYENASGELILFCGADVQIGPQTISRLVEHMKYSEKNMVSVLPKHLPTGLMANLIQPLRYWWQVAIPRRIFNRPAALSTFWIIKKDLLDDSGGFGAVSRSVVPEAYFARQAVKTNDSYSFLRSSGELSVISHKLFEEQFERAIRLRYPEVHRRLELVMLIAVAEVWLMLMPFGLVIYSLINTNSWLIILSSLSVVCLTATNMMILAISSQLKTLPALINFPIICTIEVVLGTASMFQYEFGNVEWKGRNICLPVMHTQPKPIHQSRHRKRRH